MTLTPPYDPSGELVAVAVVGAIVNPTGAVAATKLIVDTDSWRADGMVTVRPLDVSPADIDLPRFSSYLKVSCWGAPATSGSDKPQWNLAHGLAGLIKRGLGNDVQHFGRTVDVGGALQYRDAIVYSAYVMTEPRRIENDPSAYARVDFDLMVDWAIA